MDADFRACTWRKDMVNTCKRPGYHKARDLSVALEVVATIKGKVVPLGLMINPYLKDGETRKPTSKMVAW